MMRILLLSLAITLLFVPTSVADEPAEGPQEDGPVDVPFVDTNPICYTVDPWSTPPVYLRSC